jgi:hypothetical protein
VATYNMQWQRTTYSGNVQHAVAVDKMQWQWTASSGNRQVQWEQTECSGSSDKRQYPIDSQHALETDGISMNTQNAEDQTAYSRADSIKRSAQFLLKHNVRS